MTGVFFYCIAQTAARAPWALASVSRAHHRSRARAMIVSARFDRARASTRVVDRTRRRTEGMITPLA